MAATCQRKAHTPLHLCVIVVTNLSGTDPSGKARVSVSSERQPSWPTQCTTLDCLCSGPTRLNAQSSKRWRSGRTIHIRPPKVWLASGGLLLSFESESKDSGVILHRGCSSSTSLTRKPPVTCQDPAKVSPFLKAFPGFSFPLLCLTSICHPKQAF